MVTKATAVKKLDAKLRERFGGQTLEDSVGFTWWTTLRASMPRTPTSWKLVSPSFASELVAAGTTLRLSRRSRRQAVLTISWFLNLKS